MDKQPSVTRFHINDKFMYIKVFWKPNESDLLNLKLYVCGIIWSGRFSYAFASKYQELNNETEEQYYNSAKKALKKDPNFNYSFTNLPDDNNSATFSWKKKVEGGEIVHGCVPIHRVDAKKSKALLLDFLLAENHDLRSTVNAVNRKNEELTANLEKCKQDLDKFVEIKNSLEMSLCDKFDQLLKAKKRRMQLLEMSPRDDATTNVNNINEEEVM